MNPAEILSHSKELTEATQHLSTVELFVIISALSSLFVATAYPVVKMIQRFTAENKTDVKRSEAEELLYQHLIEQIGCAKKEVEETAKENRALWDQVKELQIRTSRLEALRADYELLKKLIEEKEIELKKREEEVIQLKKMLTEKENDVKLLETRLEALEKKLHIFETARERPLF
jgi:predicted RNase H-like nuclease (RuvC/YqgF family)